MTWQDGNGLLDADEGRAPGSAATLWFTTNPGLEDVVADEFSERLNLAGIATDTLAIERRPLGCRGNVITRLPVLRPADLAAAQQAHETVSRQLRSVHHVVRPLYGFVLPADSTAQLDCIATQVAERGVPPLATEAATFRVTTRRSGTHDFGSMDVQRRGGAALVQRYGLSVDLHEPDCEVRIDVIGDRCLVGVQLTGESLSRRKQRQYNPRGALKSNVAYAMLRFAGISSGRILDPFCGSATIPIEAALEHPGLSIDASDYSPKAVDGAGRNILAAGLDARIILTCRDICELPEYYDAASFDAVVTNPPFGVRIGRGMNFFSFYQTFFDSAAHVLKPGGLLVFLAWKRGIVDRANRTRRRFRRCHVRVVETGGIYPRIYVYERLSEDGG